MSIREKQRAFLKTVKGMSAGEAGKIWKRLYHV